MDVLADPRAWAADRLHLTPEAHERVALRVLECLGEPVAADWRAPWPDGEPTPWVYRQAEDLRWLRDHVMPWMHKRLRGEDTENYLPKRPELCAVLTPLEHNERHSRATSLPESGRSFRGGGLPHGVKSRAPMKSGRRAGA